MPVDIYYCIDAQDGRSLASKRFSQEIEKVKKLGDYFTFVGE